MGLSIFDIGGMANTAFASPLGGFVTDFFFGEEDRKAMEAFRVEEEGRAETETTRLSDLRTRSLDATEDLNRDLLNRFSGLGGQERSDINRAFDEEKGNRLQDLSSRGLGGTTIRSNIGAGVERERADAQGRLGERLRREEIGLRAGLGTGLIERDIDLTRDESRLQTDGIQRTPPFTVTGRGG